MTEHEIAHGTFGRRTGEERLRHLTRIVATVGPASRSEEMLDELIDAGVDVFRLNFSHGSHEEHGEVIDRIRAIAERRRVTIGILQDVPGPKLRIHKIEGGSVDVEAGQSYRLDTGIEVGDASGVGFEDSGWLSAVKEGHRVLLGDGTVILRVEELRETGLETTVVAGGTIRSRQGIAFPDSQLELSAVTSEDWKHIEFGLEKKVDAIALSFVQSADDVIAVRRFVQGRNSEPMLVAKIEQPAAVENIDAIIERSDGIMIARGDLGITLPLEQVPVVQKRLIQKSRIAGKFVITATQMLETMTTQPRPTRAEATDVANAVYDGTDGVMLSGETAVGNDPVNVVKTMARILSHTEPEVYLSRLKMKTGSIGGAMARAVRTLVDELGAAAVLVPTFQGTSAVRMSRQKMGVPILAGTLDPVVSRRIGFYNGVFPLYSSNDESSTKNTVEQMVAIGLSRRWVREGDIVIISGGFPVQRGGKTNWVRALRVGDPI